MKTSTKEGEGQESFSPFLSKNKIVDVVPV